MIHATLLAIIVVGFVVAAVVERRRARRRALEALQAAVRESFERSAAAFVPLARALVPTYLTHPDYSVVGQLNLAGAGP